MKENEQTTLARINNPPKKKKKKTQTRKTQPQKKKNLEKRQSNIYSPSQYGETPKNSHNRKDEEKAPKLNPTKIYIL